jgi:hypothetical protein
MLCITQARFHIPHDCVQPLEDWHLLRLPATHDHSDVLAPCSGCGPKAAQAIRKVCTYRYNFILGPGFDGFACKSTNLIHLDVNRPSFVVQLYGRDKRNLVFRSATSLAATELSAEVDIVNVDDSLQEVLTVTLLHNLHQLVLDPPSIKIAYPKLSSEFHRRDPVCSVGD